MNQLHNANHINFFFLFIPQVISPFHFINMTWPEESVLIFLKFQKLISSSKGDWMGSYHSSC